jgi:hypothetical protein
VTINEEKIRAEYIEEREKALDEVEPLQLEALRRIEGAFAGGEDQMLILYEYLAKDNPEVLEQLAALAVRVFRGAGREELFSGDDPGDEVEEWVRDELGELEHKRLQEEAEKEREEHLATLSDEEREEALRKEREALTFWLDGIYTRVVD